MPTPKAPQESARRGWAFVPAQERTTVALPTPLRGEALAADDALGALGYARGSYLIHVELGEKALRQLERDYSLYQGGIPIAGGRDASALICSFARWCAFQVLNLWQNHPAIVRDYLMTGDPQLQETVFKTAVASSEALRHEACTGPKEACSRLLASSAAALAAADAAAAASPRPRSHLSVARSGSATAFQARGAVGTYAGMSVTEDTPQAVELRSRLMKTASASTRRVQAEHFDRLCTAWLEGDQNWRIT